MREGVLRGPLLCPSLTTRKKRILIEIEDAFSDTAEVQIHGNEDIAVELIDFVDKFAREAFPEVDSQDIEQVAEFGVRCFLAGQIFQAANHVVTLALTEQTVSQLVENLLERQSR